MSNIEEAIETMQHWIDYEKKNKDKINKADELIEVQETILKELEKKDKIINKISEEVKENLAFEKRLKRENIEPDSFNQGKFYISENINNILKSSKR